MLPRDVKEKIPTVPRGPEAREAAYPFYLVQKTFTRKLPLINWAHVF